ncbi:hypothetical protein TVAG_321000 [Trichomonas vaginalis G3]|uniref:receptor protein-tyrosine kinase n=1 Tax=Trichomonas vaginalis (strain ATCC PRA-98 / G3) TaxID=412133 RepID=A2F808_TRIV3|nr:glycine-rich protein family [Trichomonas vaginalis G3]EAX98940.1 hypothetical protein TVAG_321000 [Trichomonas vaginalis G3]KAI5533494.1 glycine-rich protein family [Trichomonas vaginalis G3]|eukprot:XP_001311870.1 hypothetical protein [Trichomonas vaginalis G3]
MDEYFYPTLGGWNFGGQGSVDKKDQHYEAQLAPPESGAGGGGATDLRTDFIDLNKPYNDTARLHSLKSRIIVAGSGGGAVSDEERYGFPGGTLTALNNGENMFGGTQTEGELGKGMDGLNSGENQGGMGGCGSGYRGGYHNFTRDMKEQYSYEFGGSGGSSYISGHPGCISPHYPENSIPNKNTPFHESNLYFTNTDMKSGRDLMPDPFSYGEIFGHVGNGICRITFLSDYNCKTNNLPYSCNRMFSIHLIIVGSQNE